MYSAKLQNTIDSPWTLLTPIRVGRVPAGEGTPGIYVTVERDDVAFARVEAWPTVKGPFTQIEVWKRFVVLGWNECAFLIDPTTHQVIGVDCDGYFGHLYPLDDHLLIADASRLVCIDENGQRLWESDCLGIDGIIVDSVQDGVITGRGEWDPPGDWKAFQLMLTTGQRVPSDS